MELTTCNTKRKEEKWKKEIFVGKSEGMRPRGRLPLNDKIILIWILNRDLDFRLNLHGLV